MNLHYYTHEQIIQLFISRQMEVSLLVILYVFIWQNALQGEHLLEKTLTFFFLRQANFIISSSNLFCYLNNVNIVESHILKNKFSPWRPEYFTSMWTETCLMGSLLHSILEQGWTLAFLIPQVLSIVRDRMMKLIEKNSMKKGRFETK